jgi:hypothetical protein
VDLTGKIARSTFFWFAIGLLGLELGCWWLLPYTGHPTAAEAPRNPTYHRAWPEYIDVDDRAAERKLAIIITNSQGVGREVPDKRRIYSSLVRHRIERAGLPIDLENWASGGIRTVEAELLSIEAARREPDLVVMALAFSNLDPPSKLNLDFPFSDIKLLAGNPANWWYLSGTTFYESTDLEDLLPRTAALYTNLARSRVAVTDAIVQRLPMRWHSWVVGREVRPKPRLDETRDPAGSIYWADQTEQLAQFKAVQERRRRKAAGRRHVSRSDLEVRLATFRRMYPGLSDRLTGAGARVAWVWVPVDFGTMNRRSRDALDWFVSEASAVIEQSGATAHDFHEAIPSRRFVTPGHFDELGQSMFADMIYPVITDELQ